jgi:hypothetical protein
MLLKPRRQNPIPQLALQPGLRPIAGADNGRRRTMQHGLDNRPQIIHADRFNWL